jgi:hypothetical protein
MIPYAPASMQRSAARFTLGIPIFREFLSNATLLRFTLKRVIDIHRRGKER